jgi:hypothetical protein
LKWHGPRPGFDELGTRLDAATVIKTTVIKKGNERRQRRGRADS